MQLQTSGKTRIRAPANKAQVQAYAASISDHISDRAPDSEGEAKAAPDAASPA